MCVSSLNDQRFIRHVLLPHLHFFTLWGSFHHFMWIMLGLQKLKLHRWEEAMSARPCRRGQRCPWWQESTHWTIHAAALVSHSWQWQWKHHEHFSGQLVEEHRVTSWLTCFCWPPFALNSHIRVMNNRRLKNPRASWEFWGLRGNKGLY